MSDDAYATDCPQDVTYRLQTRELMREAGVEESIKRLNNRRYTGFEEDILARAGMTLESERYSGHCSSMDKILEEVRLKQAQLAIEEGLRMIDEADKRRY